MDAPSTDEHDNLTRTDRQRRVVTRCLEALADSDPDLYYQPTAVVARAVHAAIDTGCKDDQDRSAVKGLSAREIEVLLAFR
jgi:hypothetical protein